MLSQVLRGRAVNTDPHGLCILGQMGHVRNILRILVKQIKSKCKLTCETKYRSAEKMFSKHGIVMFLFCTDFSFVYSIKLSR